MLVIVKSGPDTPEGRRGAGLAGDMAAAVVLLQNGVYFMQGSKLADAGFSGKTYLLEDDRVLRGLSKDTEKANIEYIDYDGLVDLISESDKVMGMF
ncbi:MAG: DsrH/TusB family sulfur metabolism protein [Nitrospiraceae bacterium]|nr:DsrH/TusB family sulfur metabolism protein [Nitrospiraceae bacterium]